MDVLEKLKKVLALGRKNKDVMKQCGKTACLLASDYPRRGDGTYWIMAYWAAASTVGERLSRSAVLEKWSKD